MHTISIRVVIRVIVISNKLRLGLGGLECLSGCSLTVAWAVQAISEVFPSWECLAFLIPRANVPFSFEDKPGFNSRYNVSDPPNYGGAIDPVPVKYRQNHQLKAELM